MGVAVCHVFVLSRWGVFSSLIFFVIVWDVGEVGSSGIWVFVELVQILLALRTVVQQVNVMCIIFLFDCLRVCGFARVCIRLS